jgi:hypothetical protein
LRGQRAPEKRTVGRHSTFPLDRQPDRRAARREFRADEAVVDRQSGMQLPVDAE